MGSPGTATVTIRSSDQRLDASISRVGGRFVGAGKIDAAQIAAEVNPKYRVNLDALRDALPTPLTPEDIAAKAGAVWISPAVHQQFLRELVRDDTVTVSCPLPTDWKVRGGMRRTVLATSEWGTARRSAHEIFERMLRQDEMRVIDEIEDGDTIRRVVNPTESAAMQEKADLIAFLKTLTDHDALSNPDWGEP